MSEWLKVKRGVHSRVVGDHTIVIEADRELKLWHWQVDDGAVAEGFAHKLKDAKGISMTRVREMGDA